MTRKGAVRAGAGDLGIIPGSMGAKSYIVRGKGNAQSFQSCAHGAGRQDVARRGQAALHAGRPCRRHRRPSNAARTPGVIDETPMAYKDIDAVMAAQDGPGRDRAHAAPGGVRQGLIRPSPARRAGGGRPGSCRGCGARTGRSPPCAPPPLPSFGRRPRPCGSARPAAPATCPASRPARQSIHARAPRSARADRPRPRKPRRSPDRRR